ncbi:integrase family protein [Acinetobacter sp. Marseille-Q1618]|uniref:integrase family protein n=1 Tax=Acinetobacter sp. Marseille-Q1618 TaxID=2697502 RepID=UPI0015707D51|nr:integrase family protein [Acinetobacter sp. Marseille-Q1618]
MSNQKTKLTKTFVDSVPLSPDKQFFYRDAELIGFALRVTASKVYVVERRIGDGKSSVRVVLGRHTELTLEQAREKAQILLTQMASGINPNKQKQKNKKSKLENNLIPTEQPTLMTAYNAYIKHRQLGEKTLKDYRMCVEDYLFEWKAIKLIDITTQMVQEKHAELTLRSKARANLSMRFLRAVFNFAIKYYLDSNGKSILDISNPVNILSAKNTWNKLNKSKGYITKQQLPHWIDTVLSTQWVGQNYYNHNAYTNQDFLLILLLTGLGREEVECLQWENVDFKAGTITAIDSNNTSSITLPMGPILQYIIHTRFERSGNKPYVFQARQGEGHITNRSKARYKISELSGIAFTYHDLRRTFLNIANRINISAYTIKKLTHHSLDHTEMTSVYREVSFEDLYLAMTQIEQVIFTAQQFAIIKNRQFKVPTRHHDYLEKSMSLKLEEKKSDALSKIDQLKILMQP